MRSLHSLRRALVDLGTAPCIRDAFRIEEDATFLLGRLAGVPESLPVPVHPHRVTGSVLALQSLELLFRLQAVARIRKIVNRFYQSFLNNNSKLYDALLAF